MKEHTGKLKLIEKCYVPVGSSGKYFYFQHTHQQWSLATTDSCV